MLRAEIRNLVHFDYDETLTIRRVVEWYKNLLTTDLGTLTGEELEYMNTQYGSLIQTLADTQSVPVGWLAANIAELAQHELTLRRVAELELEGAVDGEEGSLSDVPGV